MHFASNVIFDSFQLVITQSSFLLIPTTRNHVGYDDKTGLRTWLHYDLGRHHELIGFYEAVFCGWHSIAVGCAMRLCSCENSSFMNFVLYRDEEKHLKKKKKKHDNSCEFHLYQSTRSMRVWNCSAESMRIGNKIRPVSFPSSAFSIRYHFQMTYSHRMECYLKMVFIIDFQPSQIRQFQLKWQSTIETQCHLLSHVLCGCVCMRVLVSIVCTYRNVLHSMPSINEPFTINAIAAVRIASEIIKI